MSCYHPLQAWQGMGKSASGKREIFFKRPQGLFFCEVQLPCGKCVGCLLERSRQWAVRCMHESQLHEFNCVVVLTYASEFLPKYSSVDVRDFQLFMKRLRKSLNGKRVRFFHCGEYTRAGRPHYHALLFGHDFNDRVYYRTSDAGFKIYRSERLSSLWGKGECFVHDLSFESAAYVARYVLKKVNVDLGNVDHHLRKPEYVTMSRRPGIGFDWFKKFASDVFPSDSVVMRGVEMQPPKFYDSILETEDPDKMSSIKYRRIRRALDANKYRLEGGLKVSEGDVFRRSVKERVKLARLKSLSRNLEEDL